MILLNALKPSGLLESEYHGMMSCEKVPKGYKNTNRARIFNLGDADTTLEKYKY